MPLGSRQITKTGDGWRIGVFCMGLNFFRARDLNATPRVLLQQYSRRGVEISRSEKIQPHTKDPDTPPVACLCYLAGSEWHLGEIDSCQATIAEAISIAKEVNDMHALAL